MNKRWLWKGIIGTLATVLLASCTQKKEEIVVYSSVDQVFSEPILKEFERQSGISVKMVFDTEETKSTGVMNRLIAEKKNPQCDLFWSGDPLRNIMLKAKGITAPYHSEATNQIPLYAQDQEGHWIGFSARARVLIYNKKLLSQSELPRTIFDLTHSRYHSQIAMANPLFGTTTFHIAALFSALGDEKGKAWLDALKRNGVVVATSNGDVKRRVLRGEIAMGLTDTDDAFEAKKESSEIDYIFLDQDEGEIGTLIMPNALSLIAHSPNPQNAKILMDHLLSKEVEAKLAKSCAQMPLIQGSKKIDGIPDLKTVVPMQIPYNEISATLSQIQGYLQLWLER